MARLDDIHRKSSLGGRLARPLVAYLTIVLLGVWVFYAVDGVRQRGDIAGAALAAAGALLGPGLVLAASLSLLLIPAVALTVALIHRFEAASRVARAAIGAGSWAAWCLVVAIVLATASGIVLVPDMLIGDLFLFAIAGAGFSLLAFDGYERRVGKALVLVALAVSALFLIGNVWMAGRWGVPV